MDLPIPVRQRGVENLRRRRRDRHRVGDAVDRGGAGGTGNGDALDRVVRRRDRVARRVREDADRRLELPPALLPVASLTLTAKFEPRLSTSPVRVPL